MRFNLCATRPVASLLYLSATVIACGGLMACGSAAPASIHGESAAIALLQSPVRGDVALVSFQLSAGLVIKDAEILIDDGIVASFAGQLPGQAELPLGDVKDGEHRLALVVHASDGDLRRVVRLPVHRAGGEL